MTLIRTERFFQLNSFCFFFELQTGGGQAGGTGRKAMGEKPDGCVRLFIGNLSYEIDDDVITKFFAAVDAELKAVRWLHHRDSGDFKGW